jgi:hypothetical protein
MNYREGEIVKSKTTGWHDGYTGKDMLKAGDKLRLENIGTWKTMFRMAATNLRNKTSGYVYPEDIKKLRKVI